MSYDTKAQKNRPQLETGAALSTLVFEPVAGPAEEEEREDGPPAGHEHEPADESSSEKDR